MMEGNTLPHEFNQPEAGKQFKAAEVNPVANEITNLDLLMDVNLGVTVELGCTRLSLRQVLELQNGSVVELDRLAGDPVDVFINNRLIARGEVVVVDDKFGVRISELISQNGKSDEG